MTARSEYERFEASSDRARRLLRQEELILQVTIALCSAMASASVSRMELAKKIGKTPGFISQVLSGNRNLTLRTISDLADALDLEPRLFLSAHVESAQNVVPFRLPTEWAPRSVQFSSRTGSSRKRAIPDQEVVA